MIQWLKTKFREAGFDIVRMNKDKLSNRDLYEHDLKVVVTSNNPVIVDVGANKGQSIEVFLKIFPNAIIYSFEPNEVLCESLIQGYKDNSRVHIFCAALGAKDEQKEFFIYKTTELSSFNEVTDNDVNPFKHEEIDKKVISEVQTLDSFLLAHSISKVDLLKIDTQGYEMEVIRGASLSLDEGVISHIYLELNFIDLYKGQSDPLSIFEFLFRKKYALVGLYDLDRPQKYIRWANGLFSYIPR